jgi:hypothetical protein
MEYLPTPRPWKWALNRLKRRITLSSHTSTVDISIMLDEMLTDMNLFQCKAPYVHLLRIAGSTQVR